MEKLQNSQNLPFQINLDDFGRKILEKLQNSMLIRSLDWCTWQILLVPGYLGNEFTFVHNANNADNDADNNNHGQKGDW